MKQRPSITHLSDIRKHQLEEIIASIEHPDEQPLLGDMESSQSNVAVKANQRTESKENQSGAKEKRIQNLNE